MSDMSRVTDFYEGLASWYDPLATAPVVRGWRAMAAEELSLSAGDTVVEMGCGTGANLPYLRERVGSEGRVVGIDLTPGMLDRARTRIERAGWANVSVCRGDAARPPVTEADAVLGSFVVGLFDDPATTVDRWLDVLRPDGRIAILEAGRSERTVAAPLNLAFRLFLRFSSPGGWQRGRSPARELDRKITTAQEVIAARTVERRYRTAALGLVSVTSGRLE
ncbi:class I SAM-dependent methyltransferase [Halapricum hydrolyticum]|uniref:Methyltransferase domain-containing protein n=1 Tax=Halapricum hydrolyticum TaxID=2979991 RepID=A0AAE3IC27_9EURY|nr:methyltransferase domain-containing protein [Halapricum hydrolyticum]MCU4718959.1 methyltransferase domain-containing protein [Halapricum hydrolyticum]MCU4727888.1 methyltransferase domain-containing protein [Halapricum hydrolyticum]